MKKHKLKIFCDFDGTVTKKDVWVDALGKFITDKNKFELVCRDFENNRITGRECIQQELALVEDFNFDIFDSYINQQELDDYFYDFMNFCNENEWEIILLSEGLDYYIKKVLNKFNINIKYYCNTLITHEEYVNGKRNIHLSAEFPFSDENCSWCGMSKRNVLIANTNDYDKEISVFIGDGVSDFCVSNFADVVFAKKSLASYCWKNNITYHEFNDFSDVIKKINKLIDTNKLKQKQNAKTLRKDVLSGG